MPLSGDFDFTYPSKLKAIGITLLDTFIGAKNYHLMECDKCKHQWRATPLSKLQNFKKWKNGGCPQCTIKHKHNESRKLNIEKLSERFEILSEWDGRVVQDISNEPLNITVRNKQCGHTFTSTSKNLLTRDVICPTCNAARKRAAFQQFNIDRSIEYHKNAPAWDSYKDTVYLLTSKAYNKHKHTINPNNLPRGLAGTPGVYHVDHIVPVRYCFDNNIPVDICSHYTNLQMLSWENNLLTKEHLKEGVEIPQIFAPYISIV